LALSAPAAVALAAGVPGGAVVAGAAIETVPSATALVAARLFAARLLAGRSLAVFVSATIALGFASTFGDAGALDEFVPDEQPANQARPATTK